MQIRISGIEQEMARLRAEINLQSKAEVMPAAHTLVEELREATPKKTGHAARSWEVVQNPDGTATVKNDVPYIDSLNHGHSKQAPEYFIEQTVLNNKDVVPNGAIVSYR